MPHRVEYSSTARRHLRNLTIWIGSQAGHAIAGAYVDRIIDACDALADYPDCGTRRTCGRRSIPFRRRATIYYRVEGRTVIILAVHHRGRDLPE